MNPVGRVVTILVTINYRVHISIKEYRCGLSDHLAISEIIIVEMVRIEYLIDGTS